jgi:bacterioferritin
MKGDSKVIAFFNTVLESELTAINQYFLHARMYKNWGFTKLNEKEYLQSINEMKYADKVIERILFLEGLPNLQSIGKISIGEHPLEMLKCDLRLENIATSLLLEAISYCESVKDFVSRELLEHILENKEKQIDWLETQLELIEKIGIQRYLQTQM